MDTTKRFVVMSILAGIIDIFIMGVCGLAAFFLCKKILNTSDALAMALFLFVGTTAYYRTLGVPIVVFFKHKKLKLLWAFLLTPVIFVIGFLYGICSATIVPIAYFLPAVLMTYESFVTLHKERTMLFGLTHP